MNHGIGISYLSSVTRLLDLIVFLSGNKRGVQQLANRFGVHRRTIYRYLSLIQDAGFEISEDGRGGYSITKWPDGLKRVVMENKSQLFR